MNRRRAVEVYYVRNYSDMSDKNIDNDKIIEQDDTPQWSGLYDHEGNKLYKKKEKVKIGFQI